MDYKISIIVPIYNVRGYLERCIESICNQSYYNIEIILVDDGATDGSGGICDEYAKRDARIRVIHKKNGGLVSARKKGVEYATGSYVMCVDGDDWIEKNRVKNVVQILKEQPADLVYMSGRYRDKGEQQIKDSVPIFEGYYRGKEEIHGKFIPSIFEGENFYNSNVAFALWTWCIKIELYKQAQIKVDDEVTLGEDILVIADVISNCESINCINESGYHYVVRDTSMVRCADSHDIKKIYKFSEVAKLILEKASDDIKDILVKHIYFLLLESNYDSLVEENNCLIPYINKEPQETDNVIVYGAGNVGKQLARNIIRMPKYNLVSWVDKNKSGEIVDGRIISSVESILEEKYDYVVIAVMYAAIAKEIATELNSRGIPKEKLLIMTNEMVTKDNLPNAIKEILNI